MNPLQVQQEAFYGGDGYWNWAVWLEAPAMDLDQVSYVKLAAGGWGEFRDGSQRFIDHQLRLVREVEEPAPQR